MNRSSFVPWALALALAAHGCKRAEPESAPSSTARPTSNESAAPAPTGSASVGCLHPSGTRDVSVAWSNVTRSSNCFFFSGPQGLGRDTTLGTSARWEEEGPSVALAFGVARFVGDPRRAPLQLTRTANHEFNGRWRITETITGQWSKPNAVVQTLMQGECPEFEGTYAYQECHEGHPAECPGPCVISAKIRLKNAGSN